MKDKIILFVIGVLVGAVISTGAFYIYTTTNKNCNNQSVQNNSGQPPQINSGQNGEDTTPPEKPSENNTQDSNQNSNS